MTRGIIDSRKEVQQRKKRGGSGGREESREAGRERER